MDIIPPCNHKSFIQLTETKESRCEECGGQISGTAFTCIWCKVWKHVSCADKLNRNLPLEIIHPLHLQHRLQLQWDYFSDFICDKCLYISTGCIYKCSSCDFSLDLTCGSSISGQLPKDQEPLRFKDGKKKTIFHYSHRHELGFFKYRKVCGDKIPRTLSHSFHPKHPLRLTYTYENRKCNVCSEDKVASGKLPSSSTPPMENKVLFVEQNEGSHVIRTLV
ncbi:hypothetical protein Goshw_013323, partial [Gossypium schwendimanii]|nr:hypothetical protein [Gossypium schwendimanii]